METQRPPRDDLVRAMWPGVGYREDATPDDDSIGTLTGHFARFGEWTEIHSDFEGHFLERFERGAFADTIAEDRDAMRVLFQHGRDPQIGDKPLGRIAELQEDRHGASYEVPLIDTSYNRDLLPGLKAGVYGASMRFSVPEDGETFTPRPPRSKHNPEGLPERVVSRAQVLEFGPVTFPAYAGATAGVRSLTDSFRELPLEPAPPARKEIPPVSETPAPVETPAPPAPVIADDYVTRDEKAARADELRAVIARVAVEYPGSLPPEVQAQWDTDNAELERHQRDIAAWDERQARVASFATSARHTVEPASQAPQVIMRRSEAEIYDVGAIAQRSNGPEQRDQMYRDNAMRSVEAARFGHPRADQDGARSHIAFMLDNIDSPDKELARRILITGSPVYRRAFNKQIKGQSLSPEEQRAAALAVGVDTTGGFAVPYAFDPTIIAIGAHTSTNPYRQACRVETIVGTDTWRGVTSTAVTAAYATEAAAATEQGPTFARPELVAKRGHVFATVSNEMMQDRADIASELGVLFQEAKDTLEENQFSIGTGATVYPFGMCRTLAYTAVTTVTNDVTAVADILAMEAGVPIRHRANAAWFLTRAGIRAIQAWETAYGQLFNGANYPAVGNPNVGGNTGLKLLGYPVWEAPSIPWLPTTDGSINGWLGDPKSYMVLDRIGMSVEIIPHMLDGATPSMPTGERGVYAMWRGTARPLNVDAGRQLTVQ